MDIYVFSSKNLTNIWAAIGARKWAVSIPQSKNPSIRTRGRKLPIGSLGLFYCVKEQSLTTPFVIRSKPSQEALIENIWPEIWALPFNIIPFGSPDKRLHKNRLNDLLPSLKNKKTNWNKLIFVSPNTVFSASKITEEDWSVLINSLV